MIFFFFEILQHNSSRQRDLSIPKNFVPKFLPSARGLHKFLWTVCYCVIAKIKKKKFLWGGLGGNISPKQAIFCRQKICACY
jgi:hypothetical protein